MRFFLITISVILFYSSLSAKVTSQNEDSLYLLSYNSKDSNCTLTKDGVKLPSFDPRFKKKAPKNPYTCFAIQKEQYNDCVIVDKHNVTAVVFSYGAYEQTNLVISFKTATKHTDGSMTVKCTKSLHKISK